MDKETGLQFLRELHFIEARCSYRSRTYRPGCSSFGSCTSLRHLTNRPIPLNLQLQFLRELHFTEAGGN